MPGPAVRECRLLVKSGVGFVFNLLTDDDSEYFRKLALEQIAIRGQVLS